MNLWPRKILGVLKRFNMANFNFRIVSAFHQMMLHQLSNMEKSLVQKPLEKTIYSEYQSCQRRTRSIQTKYQ